MFQQHTKVAAGLGKLLIFFLDTLHIVPACDCSVLRLLLSWKRHGLVEDRIGVAELDTSFTSACLASTRILSLWHKQWLMQSYIHNHITIIIHHKFLWTLGMLWCSYTILYNEKHFSDDLFSYVVRVITWGHGYTSTRLRIGRNCRAVCTKKGGLNASGHSYS